MGWSLAYHYHLDKEVSIEEAIKIRNGNDPRAGDLHCHRECFEKKTGTRLLTRRESSNGKKAHFARWPRGHTKGEPICESHLISISKRESMDYARYYTDFESFLSRLNRGSEPYFIDDVNKGGSDFLQPDFVISHSKNNPHGIVRTEIHIVDENKRRKKRFPESRLEGRIAEMVIRISEYTLEQLGDFKRGGIERFHTEWVYLMSLIQKQNKIYEMEEIKMKEKEIKLLEQEKLFRRRENEARKRRALLAKREKREAMETANRLREREYWVERCQTQEELLAPVYKAYLAQIGSTSNRHYSLKIPRSWRWWLFFWVNHDDDVKKTLLEWRMGIKSDEEFWNGEWEFFDEPNEFFSRSDYSSMSELIQNMVNDAWKIYSDSTKISAKDDRNHRVMNLELFHIHSICFTPYLDWEMNSIARAIRRDHPISDPN